MIIIKQVKAFEIPKGLVLEAYRSAKANRGAPGVDKMTFSEFDKNREKNLYKIWNRLSSGTYFPPPVKEKAIPKDDGSFRKLGIPTVADRIAQGTVKLYLEKLVEPLFHEDSYGYRPGKSAHQAIETTWKRCHKQFWLLEIDIKGFFDNVNRSLIVKSLEHIKAPKWAILYCKRWMEAKVLTREGSLVTREKGTPQGGVISPLLANLFLHFALDQWVTRNFSEMKFCRFADDAVFHLPLYSSGLIFLKSLRKRMEAVGLELNESKTNLVYLGTYERPGMRRGFTFLGYDFEHRTLKNYRTGELYRKVTPGASRKAMKRISAEIKSWRIHRWTTESSKYIANQYNAVLRGWIEYYGKFWYRKFSYHLWSVFQSRLLKWVKAKFRIGNKKAMAKLDLLRQTDPRLFAHWYLLRNQNVWSRAV